MSPSTRARHRKMKLEKIISRARNLAFSQWVELSLEENPNGSSWIAIKHFDEAWIKSLQPQPEKKRARK